MGENMGYIEGVQGFLGVPLYEYFGDYQGDIVCIVSPQLGDGTEKFWNTPPFRWRNRVVGLLVIGYGSCSGCDSWEGCDDGYWYTPGSTGAKPGVEHAKLIAEILEDVRWFENLDALCAWIVSEDAKRITWVANDSEWPAFVEKVLALRGYIDGDAVEQNEIEAGRKALE